MVGYMTLNHVILVPCPPSLGLELGDRLTVGRRALDAKI